MVWYFARRARLLAAVFCVCIAASVAEAQEGGIDWQVGPAIGKLGDVAEITVPEGYRFAGSDGVRKFMELTQNPVGGNELGVILPPEGAGEWFVVFEFNRIGYVKDNEKDALDADAILKSIKEGTAYANEERRKRGWSTVDVVGWHSAPRYDTVTNNLTWAIVGASEGDRSVNHSVRLLGRSGVMKADLVLDAKEAATALPEFDQLLTQFQFTSGNKYAEFVPGDKIAEYGLTALVAGGLGAAAAKSGLLGKLWKFIVLGVVGAFAALKKALGSLFGKRDPEVEASTTAQ
jgi:uncharacterized membrane-anchored protein